MRNASDSGSMWARSAGRRRYGQENVFVIEDLDGGDIGPSRAPIVRAVSVVLMLATAIGWAVLQSPALRGPYATPDPRAISSTPALTMLHNDTGTVIAGYLEAPRQFACAHIDPSEVSTAAYVVVRPASFIAPDGMAFRVDVPPTLDAQRLVAPPATVYLTCVPVRPARIPDLLAR
jgi:hypothetical protein